MNDQRIQRMERMHICIQRLYTSVNTCTAKRRLVRKPEGQKRDDGNYVIMWDIRRSDCCVLPRYKCILQAMENNIIPYSNCLSLTAMSLLPFGLCQRYDHTQMAGCVGNSLIPNQLELLTSTRRKTSSPVPFTLLCLRNSFHFTSLCPHIPFDSLAVILWRRTTFNSWPTQSQSGSTRLRRIFTSVV